MTHIVGLIGKRGAGKSAAAQMLCSQNGFQLVKFADGLKNMLRALGLNEEEIEGPLKEQPCELLMGKTPRHAMQTLGTEWGRNRIHPSFWVNNWVHRAVQHSLVVVDDCRFANEAKTIKDNGGKLIRILRSNNPYDQSGEASVHKSESEMDSIQCDVEVQNDSSLMKLYKKVYNVAF